MLLSPSPPPHLFQHHSALPGSPHSVISLASAQRGRPVIRSSPQGQTQPWTTRLMNIQTQAQSQNHATLTEENGSEDDEGLVSSSITAYARDQSASKDKKSSSPSPISPVGASRSILTMLLEQERGRNDSTASDTTVIAREATARTTLGADSPPLLHTPPSQSGNSSEGSSDQAPTPRATDEYENRLEFPTSSPPRRKIRDEEQGLDESRKPLLSNSHRTYDSTHAHHELRSASTSFSSSTPPAHAYTSPHPHSLISSQTNSPSHQLKSYVSLVSSHLTPKAFMSGVALTVTTFPAVLLGLLLNILDGVSYGFIIFPAGPVFAGFGSIGVSMFFVT